MQILRKIFDKSYVEWHDFSSKLPHAKVFLVVYTPISVGQCLWRPLSDPEKRTSLFVDWGTYASVEPDCLAGLSQQRYAI